MSPQFEANIIEITSWLGAQAIQPGLAASLSEAFPIDGEVFSSLAVECRKGVAEGWLAQRGDDALRWGRPIKPAPETNGYSVDVVRMTDIAGPHHAHPQGEIDMIIPLDPGAKFDGQGEGWMVYGPGSAHSPTVTGGSAIVLYLLPRGEIKFSG